MNDVLSVNFDTKTVSARDLHEKLNIGTAFKDWFPRMCEYGFVEGIDFCSKLSETSVKGGRPAKDAEITVDMAKQICMIQRTPEGKQCRQYLIDLEKAWNSPEQIMARALKLAERTIESLKSENLILKPKAEYYDELVDRNLLTSFRTTAKEFGIKESVLIRWLIDNRYIYRDSRNKLNPYSTAQQRGLFQVKEYVSSTSTHAGTQTLITPKGRDTFRMLMKL